MEEHANLTRLARDGQPVGVPSADAAQVKLRRRRIPYHVRRREILLTAARWMDALRRPKSNWGLATHIVHQGKSRGWPDRPRGKIAANSWLMPGPPLAVCLAIKHAAAPHGKMCPIDEAFRACTITLEVPLGNSSIPAPTNLNEGTRHSAEKRKPRAWTGL